MFFNFFALLINDFNYTKIYIISKVYSEVFHKYSLYEMTLLPANAQDGNINALFITANVGSLFEDVSKLIILIYRILFHTKRYFTAKAFDEIMAGNISNENR